MKIIQKLMLSCQHATFLIEKKQEFRLNTGERLHLKMHLLMCHACRTYSQQSSLLNRILKNVKPGKNQRENI
jgi:predicted anti-sigma-YlaC factor YlaD